MSTPSWLSAYVEKTCDFFAGTLVPRGISGVITPPAVSRPRLSGVASITSRSPSVSVLSSPLRMAACTVAPYATASSGLIALHSSFPPKKSESSCCSFGTRVEPPTSTTSWTWPLLILASRSTDSTGAMHLRNRSAQRSSNLARVSVALKSSPSHRASISSIAVVPLDSVRLARSHAVRRRRRARGLPLMSFFVRRLNSCEK
mmetsp:Transcript_6886/g.12362  ORF Transcript_6886/g.12362 Transcript_6886/m.12362 type:complete len:202 (-) Transcript_6886:886-1491(-)